MNRIVLEWAVKCLRNNRSGGAPWMRAEHLKGWLEAARRREKGETADKEGGGREDTYEGAENWARVVELVQTFFRDGDLAEEATWQAVVLIPKGKKDYWGIVLVEVMWKVVAAILNRRFTSSITYHDALPEWLLRRHLTAHSSTILFIYAAGITQADFNQLIVSALLGENKTN